MFDKDDSSLKELEEYVSFFSKASKITHLYMTEWIPNAKTKEDALLFAQAVECVIKQVTRKEDDTWKEIFTNAYKEGKSIEAFEKLVEFGLLEYPV